ncbi:activating molecule in BECN1-regulated autophagy protein 1B-like [Tubulanus polymorphus]|uniref:activating molecule in BECN1-regulated autophagy protein 1B-like n=1 Tax=Tubulanus polymorphus TaxID=672921 RepID=UPI003DA1D675
MMKYSANLVPFIQGRELGHSHRFMNKNAGKNIADQKASKPVINKCCQLSGQTRSTFILSMSHDGSRIISTHGDHTVRVTDAVTGRCIHVLSGHPRTPWTATFHPSSNTLLASGCLDGDVRIWDLKGHGSETWKSPKRKTIASLAFHPTEQMLVIATSNKIYFWDWSQPQPFASSETNNEYEKVRWVKFDPFGHFLFTGVTNCASREEARVEHQSPVWGSSSTTSQMEQIHLRRRYLDVMDRYSNFLRDRERLLQENPLIHDTRIAENESEETAANVDPGAVEEGTDEADESAIADIDIIEPRSPAQLDALDSARLYAANVSQHVSRMIQNTRDYTAQIHQSIRSSDTRTASSTTQGTNSTVTVTASDRQSHSRLIFGTTSSIIRQRNARLHANTTHTVLTNSSQSTSYGSQQSTGNQNTGGNQNTSHSTSGNPPSNHNTSTGNQNPQNTGNQSSNYTTGSISDRDTGNQGNNQQMTDGNQQTADGNQMSNRDGETENRNIDLGLGLENNGIASELIRDHLSSIGARNTEPNQRSRSEMNLNSIRNVQRSLLRSRLLRDELHNSCRMWSQGRDSAIAGGNREQSSFRPWRSRPPYGRAEMRQNLWRLTPDETPDRNNCCDYCGFLYNSTQRNCPNHRRKRVHSASETMSHHGTQTRRSVVPTDEQISHIETRRLDKTQTKTARCEKVRQWLAANQTESQLVSTSTGQITVNNQPIAGPSNSSQPIAGPSNSSQPIAGPSNSSQPIAGPSNSNQPIAGPSNSSQPIAGPSNSNQPIAGPSNSSQPIAGPSNSNQPIAGPSNSSQPIAGPSNSSQPIAGPSKSNQPIAGPSNSSQPIAGPSNSSQPIAGPTNSSQPIAGPSKSSQPIAGPSGSAPKRRRLALMTEILTRDSDSDSDIQSIPDKPKPSQTGMEESGAENSSKKGKKLVKSEDKNPLLHSMLLNSPPHSPKTFIKQQQREVIREFETNRVRSGNESSDHITSPSETFIPESPPLLSDEPPTNRDTFRPIGRESNYRANYSNRLPTMQPDSGRVASRDFDRLPAANRLNFDRSSATMNFDFSANSISTSSGATNGTTSAASVSRSTQQRDRVIQMLHRSRRERIQRLLERSDRASARDSSLGNGASARESFREPMRVRRVDSLRSRQFNLDRLRLQLPPHGIPDIQITAPTDSPPEVLEAFEVRRRELLELNQRVPLLPREERTLQRLQRHLLHPHYAVSILDDSTNRPSDNIQSAINRAIAGAFMSTGEPAVASNIVNVTHRIQRWDFRGCDIPDISISDVNVIVPHCKIHNDASCEISQDGLLLATFVPSHGGFPDSFILAVYSLQSHELARCLYTKSFGPNAISVGISPTNNYVLVGLAAKRLSWVFSPNQMVAQIYELVREEAGESSMQHVTDVNHPCQTDMLSHVSVNTAKWMTGAGEGIIYGTNKGDLHICSPGTKGPQVKKGEDEDDLLNMRPSSEMSLRRNLMEMLGIPLMRTAGTSTEPEPERTRHRTASTQTPSNMYYHL